MSRRLDAFVAGAATVFSIGLAVDGEYQKAVALGAIAVFLLFVWKPRGES